MSEAAEVVGGLLHLADILERRGLGDAEVNFPGLVRRAARELVELRRMAGAQAPDPDGCEWCGVPLVQPKRGRPRRFCSEAHRKAAGRKSGNAKVAS